jgi:hypothetical protein
MPKDKHAASNVSTSKKSNAITARARKAMTPSMSPPIPILLEEEGDVLRLVIEGHGVDFFTWRGKRCCVAAQYGAVLEYGDEGGKLVDMIRDKWGDEFFPGHHYDVLEGDDLREFVEQFATHQQGVAKVRHVMILYEAGFDLAALLSRKPKGKALRRILVEHVIPRLRRSEAVSLKRQPPAIDADILKAYGRQLAEEVARSFTERLTKIESQVGQIRDEAKATSAVVVPHADHPERWASYGELRDAKKRAQKVKRKIAERAELCKVGFQAVHGRLRTEYTVPGYTFLRTSQIDTAIEFVDGLTADDFDTKVPPPVEANPAQGQLFDIKARGKPTNSNSKKDAG